MGNEIKILVVEDEIAISSLIDMNLSAEGYSVVVANDGEKAADILEDNFFDLVLLDIMLPKINGYELLEYIKPLNIPVIFLTAKASLDDRVKGLNLGADDYIVKPFEVAELLARVNAVLRRYHKNDDVLQFLDLEINIENKTVHKSGELLSLTPKEFSLLVYFVRNRDLVLSRESLYKAVWESEFDENTRTLELHIQRLRKKTGLENQLKTLYSEGYRLDSN